MNYIINPQTNKKVSIFSNTGKNILKNYIITYTSKKLNGGKRSDWSVELRGTDFTSYRNPSFSGIHCTIYNSGDIHCKRSGSKYAGFFNGKWKYNHRPSLDAYNDFMFEP